MTRLALASAFSLTLLASAAAQAKLCIAQAWLDLGPVVTPEWTMTEVEMKNCGRSREDNIRLSFDGPIDLYFWTKCPAALAPGESCLLEFGFAPRYPGSYMGKLIIRSSSTDEGIIITAQAL